MRSASCCFRARLAGALTLTGLIAACGSNPLNPFDAITVNVSGSGTGSGIVESSDDGVAINCEIIGGHAGETGIAECNDTFNDAGEGGSFNLVAIPNVGSVLTAWTGCSAVSGPICTLTFSPTADDTTFNVTATFSLSDGPPGTVMLYNAASVPVNLLGPGDLRECGVGQHPSGTSRCGERRAAEYSPDQPP